MGSNAEQPGGTGVVERTLTRGTGCLAKEMLLLQMGLDFEPGSLCFQLIFRKV